MTDFFLLFLGVLSFVGLRRSPYWRFLVVPVREAWFRGPPGQASHGILPKDLHDFLVVGLDAKNPMPAVLELARRVRDAFPFRLLDADGFEGKAFSIDLEDFAQRWRQNPKIKINCGPYANIFCAGCQAMGIPARVVVTGDANLNDGHVVAEVWDESEKHWFLLDVLYNCTFSAAGRRLSSLEVSRMARSQEKFEIQRGQSAIDSYTTQARLQDFLQAGLFDHLLVRSHVLPVLFWKSTTPACFWVWRLWFFQGVLFILSFVLLVRLAF